MSTKAEEFAAAAPEVTAKAEEGANKDQDEEKTKKPQGPKEEGKKKGKKGGGKGKEGKGGGKGKSQGAPSGPLGHGGSGYRLNVKNFGAEMATEDLRTLFEPYGVVTGAEVKLHEDGKSRGFGFVILSSEEEAQKAISGMNNKEVHGKPLKVSPAERRPQDEEDDKGKGKGKGKKGAEDWSMQQMQAAYFQQQMMAMQQWYAYMASMNQAAGVPAETSALATTAAPAHNPEYEGSLKSVSSRNGYGFIVCAATWARYERDVYVDKEVLPEGAQPPDRLIFTVTLNAKGHPKAATCKLAA